jgi:hypothetical protein
MRKSASTTSVLITLPPDMKRALVQEVSSTGSNMNDIVVGLLARRYGIKFVPSARSSAPCSTKPVVVLRMNPALKRRLQYDALKHESNMTTTVIRLLAEELGLPSSMKKVRRRTPFGGGRRRCI